jgi:hypothetical protein
VQRVVRRGQGELRILGAETKMNTELIPPPVLTGDAAKINRVRRELLGQYTAEDMELWKWIVLDYMPTLPLQKRQNGFFSARSVVMWKGEKIWPPS